jgi:hypothetical protein
MVNLAGDAGHAAVLKEHRVLMAKWGAELKDKFPYVAV